MGKIRLWALYLPQYHPIEENNKWWGEGFTEWTNVGKAKKYFRNHYQPRVPADLGYYDLRVPEAREAQAKMAKEHGIEGFIYWHYWFGNGKRLLERPFNEVLASGKPDFPFALAWANESWKGFAHGLKNRNVLIEQAYPGEVDIVCHFNEVLPAFKDNRYIQVDNKPVFIIYKPYQLPDPMGFMKKWRNLAIENGLNGIYFIAQIQSSLDHKGKSEDDVQKELIGLGFDAVNFVRTNGWLEERPLVKKVRDKILNTIFKRPIIYSYKTNYKHFTKEIDKNDNIIPSIITGWDHTPRSGRRGYVMKKFTPKVFAEHLNVVWNSIKDKKEKIVIIKSWNEWAEGNYLEPDLKYGKSFLREIKEKFDE